MATIETTGKQIVDTQNKRIERRVIVATGGGSPLPPEDATGELTNTIITDEPAGIKRAIYEFTTGGEESGGGGGGSGTPYKRVELLGGTREVPIYSHPLFKDLTPTQILEVQEAVENRELLVTTGAQATLQDCLLRKTEYFMAPSTIGRISTFEATLPDLEPVAKEADPQPSELPAYTNATWICTSITASPVGNSYEVVREYTLIYNPDWITDLLY